jgi:callose synthase
MDFFFFFPFMFNFLGNVVRGMMYYRRALMLQSFLERRSLGGICF